VNRLRPRSIVVKVMKNLATSVKAQCLRKVTGESMKKFVEGKLMEVGESG
jgi:hypothetical protein